MTVRGRCASPSTPFYRDGLTTFAPYDAARNVEIHGQCHLILTSIRHLASIRSPVFAGLEEGLLRSCIHREVHVLRAFAADGDRMLNWIANPETQNASGRGDRALVDQRRPKGRVTYSRPSHRPLITIKNQAQLSWKDRKQNFDLSTFRGNDLSRVGVDSEICLDARGRSFKNDRLCIDIEGRKVRADGDATLTPHRK